MYTLESERKSQILADMACLTVKPMSIDSLIRTWQKSKIHSERFVTKQRLNANMLNTATLCWSIQ